MKRGSHRGCTKCETQSGVECAGQVRVGFPKEVAFHAKSQ